MINVTFIIIIAFMITLSYTLFFREPEVTKGVEDLTASGTLIIFSASYLFSFIFPMFGVLNEAVDAERIVAIMSKSKLKILELNVLFLE